jgi:hypothetical protein
MAAAMAAFMASVLGAAGIAFSPGGGGGAPSGSTARIPMASGGVLGAAAGVGSESITKSYELLQKTYDMELTQLSGIRDAIGGLSDAIKGLVIGIIRSGITGMKSGTLSTSYADDYKMGAMRSINVAGLVFAFGGTIQKIGNMFTEAMVAWSTKGLSLFGNWGKMIGDKVGGAINWVFGGKVTTSLKNFGIQIHEISNAALQAGESIKAMGFQVIQVKTSKMFGGSKTKTNTEFFELDPEVNKFLTDVFSNMGKTLVELAKVFGTDVEAAKNYIFKAFDIDLTGLTTADEINKKLQEEFSKIGDVAVTDLFGNWLEAFQQAGEGLMETAVRVAQGIVVVKEALGMIGFAIGRGTTEQIAEFSQELIKLAGGIENFTKNISTYIDKFFSDSEKKAMMYKSVQEGFTNLNRDTGLNLVLPDTREGFRKLVEGLDLSSEAGLKAFDALMKLAGSADALYAAQEELIAKWDSLQDKLRFEGPAKTAELMVTRSQQELDAAKLYLRELVATAYTTAQYDQALQNVINAIHNFDAALARSASAQRDLTALNRRRELATTDPSLHPLMNAIYAQEDYNNAIQNTINAQNDYNTAVQNAKSAMANLTNATAALDAAILRVANARTGITTAQTNYDRVIADNANRIQDAQDSYARAVEDGAKSIASAQKRYQDSLDAIVDAQQRYDDAVINGAKRIADAQKRYADAVTQGAKSVASAEKSYANALKGITSAEKSYANAQKALADEILNQQRDAISKQFDLEAEARSAAIDAMKKEKDLVDKQLSLLEEQVNAQQTAVDQFKSISESVKKWITDMSTSELAPVVSRDTFEAEYQRLKGAATAPGAKETDVSAFLDFAKQYLDFQRTFTDPAGSDYKAIYDMVMADVSAIGDVADQQLVIAQSQLDVATAAAAAAKLSSEQLQASIDAATEADKLANEAAKAVLDSLDRSAADAAQRLLDLQQGVVDAAQGIVDAQAAADEAFLAIGEAQQAAEENIAEAAQGILDAETESARSISDAAQRIVDAQEASNEALLNISETERDVADRISSAQEAIDDAITSAADSERSALDAIANAEAELVAALAAEEAARVAEEVARAELVIAQLEESAARDRLIAAQAYEALMLTQLNAAMAALAAAPPPSFNIPIPMPVTVINFPLPTPTPVVIPNPSPYPTPAPDFSGGWAPPTSDIFNPNISPGPGYIWNEYGPAGGMWYYPGGVGDPSMTYGAIGGLYNQPTIGGEAGPEWFVPTYEPERSRFLKTAPSSFWDNLSMAGGGGGGGVGNGGGSGEVTVHSHIYLDGKEVAENVAKHIPRNAALSESIRRVK